MKLPLTAVSVINYVLFKSVSCLALLFFNKGDFMKIISIIMCFILGFFTYPVSFLSFCSDTEFDVADSSFMPDSITVNGAAQKCVISSGVVSEDGKLAFNGKLKININMPYYTWFNYYGIEYTSDAYIEGEICYKAGVVTRSENFYLEPTAESTTFYSLIDRFLNGRKANALLYVSFEPLDKTNAVMTLEGIGLFNRSIPETETYIENDGLKVGVDLLWGGAVSYVEDTDSSVELVEVDGKIIVDSKAGEKYNTEVLNHNVNLINRNDTGRLIQQSYYGAGTNEDYTAGIYNEQEWRYNPVQGGNQYNENSKIVDIAVSDNMIYIKCQPLDWSKTAEDITASYMEATYTIYDCMLKVSCRFVDFSGYEETNVTQELPAFYCIEPFNNFVYCDNGEIKHEKELIFWPDAGYPNFDSSENWAAFTGHTDDSFGIGLYVHDDGATSFLSGVYARGETSGDNPAEESPTSYMAVVKDFLFRSFCEYQYEYYITTGTADEIRNTFNNIK